MASGFGLWVNEYGRMLSPSLPITREMGPAGNFTTKKRESVSFSHDGASGQSQPEGEGVGTMISHWEAELRKK